MKKILIYILKDFNYYLAIKLELDAKEKQIAFFIISII